MNVLLINGSPRKNSNTEIVLKQMQEIFDKQDIDSEIIQVGNQVIAGCKACKYCYKNGKCVQDDIVNEVAEKFETADGLVLGSPVYYAAANGTLISFCNRLFYSTRFDKTMKVGASVACARRGGLTTTFDQLNKYFTICGMPIASGQYWNGIHGAAPGEAIGDNEGMQMTRTLANNMAFLMKSIKLGVDKYGLPEKEEPIHTNFIRKILI